MRYQVITSNDVPRLIDEDELPKVILGVNTKSAVICRQAIFVNPNFIVNIVPAPDPYEGSNIPKSEREPQGQLSDLFADIRSKVNALGRNMRVALPS